MSALASMWLPGALHVGGTAIDLLEPCLQVSMECLRCSLHLLERHTHDMTSSAASTSGRLCPSHARLLASSSGEALLAVAHIAVNQPLTCHPAQLGSLRSCVAAQQLCDCAVKVATHAIQLPARLRADLWTCLADVQVVWFTHMRTMKEREWSTVSNQLEAVVAPIAELWSTLRMQLAGANDSGANWHASSVRVQTLCEFVQTMCSAVSCLARSAKKCVFVCIQPMLEAAVALLAAAKHRGLAPIALTLSKLLTSVVRSMLSEVPVNIMKLILAATTAEIQGASENVLPGFAQKFCCAP
jgi:hypothetical protein